MLRLLAFFLCLPMAAATLIEPGTYQQGVIASVSVITQLANTRATDQLDQTFLLTAFPSDAEAPQQLSLAFREDCPSVDIDQSADVRGSLQIGLVTYANHLGCPTLGSFEQQLAPIVFGVPTIVHLTLFATAINGQATGVVGIQSSSLPSVTLVIEAIPEPSTGWLIALAMGVALVRYRTLQH